jgi:hypothetical protein
VAGQLGGNLPGQRPADGLADQAHLVACVVTADR